jgi:hypothetical protein
MKRGLYRDQDHIVEAKQWTDDVQSRIIGIYPNYGRKNEKIPANSISRDSIIRKLTCQKSSETI